MFIKLRCILWFAICNGDPANNLLSIGIVYTCSSVVAHTHLQYIWGHPSSFSLEKAHLAFVFVFLGTSVHCLYMYIFVFITSVLHSIPEGERVEPETLFVDGRFSHTQQLMARLDFVRYICINNSVFLSFPHSNSVSSSSCPSVSQFSLSYPLYCRFALKDGQLWLGHQQALMVRS